MKNQMTFKETQSFGYVWAKRLGLKPNPVKYLNRVEVLTALIKERLNLNDLAFEGLNIVVKVFDKMAYGGCGHFTRSQIKAWLMLEGALETSDLNSAIELIEELITIRGK